MNRLITLLASFTLSAFSYIVAQPDDVPVQHIEFKEPLIIQPNVQEIVFEEYIIISQDDESSDGDGENIDMMNANWCLIHPDDPVCVEKNDDDDEDYGC